MSRQGLRVGTLTRCTAWVGERQLDRQADIAGSVRTPVASTVQTPDPLTPFFSPANFKSRLHPPASRPLYSTPQQTSRAVIFLEATSPSWKQLYPWGNTSFPLLRNIPCNCSISCISTFPGTRHNPSPSFLHSLFMSTYRLLGCILQAGLIQKGCYFKCHWCNRHSKGKRGGKDEGWPSSPPG